MSCQFCKSAVSARGAFRPTVVCEHRSGSAGTWQMVDFTQSCENFTPLTGFRLGIHDGIGYIPLTQDKIALVDPADYPALVRYKWCAARNGRVFYAITRINKRNIVMHRMIINPPNEMIIDHIDHNGLNNRRTNLRICTSLQNARNRRPSKQKKIKYKGVSSAKTRKKFQANITLNQKQTIIGYYKTELQAAKAYDKKAKQYHGEYAFLNFPEK